MDRVDISLEIEQLAEWVAQGSVEILAHFSISGATSTLSTL